MKTYVPSRIQRARTYAGIRCPRTMARVLHVEEEVYSRFEASGVPSGIDVPELCRMLHIGEGYLLGHHLPRLPERFLEELLVLCPRDREAVVETVQMWATRADVPRCTRCGCSEEAPCPGECQGRETGTCTQCAAVPPSSDG